MVARGKGRAWMVPTMPTAGLGTVGIAASLGMTSGGHLEGKYYIKTVAK